jgi:Fic family protein
MLIPPRYTFTPKISEFLQEIEASKQIIDAIEIPSEIEANIRRHSTLQSSVYSARIEGSDLTPDDIIHNPSKIQKKAESANLLKAINYIKEKHKKDITESDILTIHKIAMEGLIDYENLGKWRKNMEAIFNSAGIAIYMPPPPRLVAPLMTKLIKFINSDKEQFTPLRAILAHYTFERIHPFLDGSGRVGRLLMQRVLYHGGYGMKGLLSVEEYLDNHRSEYYRMLEEPEKDVTDYVLFMLTAISETAKTAREMVLNKQVTEIEDYLLPRRAEILRIIKDQKMINFDSLQRRFLKVNGRTLRYDIKKLTDAGLIKKLGTTKGVYYKPAA